ncbi:MAG: autotransporter domain-containing protein, partial [Thermomonas sp.]
TLTLSPTTLPGGTLGVAYSQTITASGGTTPYSFAVTAGSLPTGLVLTSAGVLSGTPTASGTYAFTITATDLFGSTGSQAYTLVIVGGARPDPAKDPDVVGIETATNSVVRIFAENPMRTVDRRMDSLHDLEKGCGWWISDTTRSGGRGSDAQGSSQSFRVNGLTLGGDCPTSHHLAFGLALGYDRNRQDIGVHGSQVYGQAKSGIGYGSFHPTLPFFIDGSIGHQRINLQTRRALPGSDSMVEGERSGQQTFSSWTGGYRMKRTGWEIDGYSRIDVAKARLDGYSEDGDPTQALRYGDESIDTRTRTVGVRGKFQHKSRWGMVEPRMRVEFLHDFRLQGGTSIQYVDQPFGPEYFLAPQTDGGDRRFVELGVVLNTRRVTLNLQYLGTFGGLYGNDRGWTLTFQNSR